MTTQAQVLRLLRRLQQERNSAIIFITHDLGVIAQMADYVTVMYLGLVMEQGPVDQIFHDPKHPYTQALLESIPSIHMAPRANLPTISGSIPHPFNRPGRVSLPSPLHEVHARRLRPAPAGAAAGRREATGELLPVSRATARRLPTAEVTA